MVKVGGSEKRREATTQVAFLSTRTSKSVAVVSRSICIINVGGWLVVTERDVCGTENLLRTRSLRSHECWMLSASRSCVNGLDGPCWFSLSWQFKQVAIQSGVPRGRGLEFNLLWRREGRLVQNLDSKSQKKK